MYLTVDPPNPVSGQGTKFRVCMVGITQKCSEAMSERHTSRDCRSFPQHKRGFPVLFADLTGVNPPCPGTFPPVSLINRGVRSTGLVTESTVLVGL
jgi:hypothetical protein